LPNIGAATDSDDSICGNNIVSSIVQVAGARNDLQFNVVGHWPWMASIGYLDLNKVWKHQCGATLISNRLFLTAAHCANNE
jgi:V8-like Glu-specific endopeptidase